MSVRRDFEEAWEAKFPDTPVPTYLSFLDDEGMSSLGAALDSADRNIKKLEQELAREQFIHDFVLQQLNLSLAARSEYAAVPHRGVAMYERRKTPVTQTTSAPRASANFGRSVRTHGKTSQLAAVMAKIGFGKVNRPAIDPEDMEDIHNGKKATPLSRFYDKSNMYRASSEPSLVDCGMKHKPQPAIPSADGSGMPPGFKPIFTKDKHAKLTSTVSAYTSDAENTYFRPNSPATLLRKSTGSDLDDGHRQRLEGSLSSPEMYLETDLDSVIPPALTPQPPIDVHDGAGADPLRPQRPFSCIYEEAKEFQREILCRDTGTEADEDEATSSDEEPLYFNILQFKQQALSCASALYTNGAALMALSDSSESGKPVSEQQRLRRMAHHYEHIDPQLRKPLTLPPASADSGKYVFLLMHRFN